MSQETMTLAEYKRSKKKASKYKNVPTRKYGLFFASKKEARRYDELKLLQRAGKIQGLAFQHHFEIRVGPNGMHVCDYIGDFSFQENGKLVVEDTKGVRTPVYRLKKKLMLACHGIKIREI